MKQVTEAKRKDGEKLGEGKQKKNKSPDLHSEEQKGIWNKQESKK